MQRMTAMRRALLAVLALAPLACGGPLSAEPEWVQWFSYRWIHDLAVAPSGEITVVGRSMGDELTSGVDEQVTWRPFVARVDPEGTLIDDWLGYDGVVTEVALDDEGRAYVTIDWQRGSQSSELRALDHDGSVRWSKQWERSSWSQVVVADDVVIARAERSIEAFGLDGQPRWQASLPSDMVITAAEDGIWVVSQRLRDDGSYTLEAFALHYDARDGRQTERLLELPERRTLGTAAVTPDGLHVSSYDLDYGVYLSSLSSQGPLRWDREISSPYEEDELPMWVPSEARVIADGRDAWVVGTQAWLDPGPRGDYEGHQRHRLWLQRWSAEGEHEGTAHYVFEEPGVPDDLDPSVLAQSQCPELFPEPVTRLGSSSSLGVALPDGSLLVAGWQGCRDSFLLRLSVDR